MCMCVSACDWTYELLVAAVQRHVAERCGHGADDPVVVHPQQLHQDGQTFLLTHRRSDVRRKLHTHTFFGYFTL